MTTRKKPRSRQGTKKADTRVVRIGSDVAVEVPDPKPATDVVTDKTYITTEPKIEIRKPATLSQALTEPAVAVVKPRTKVRKEVIARTRHAA